MHYRPTDEDFFQILLQISRFLKEFSEFETDLTPKFRHPPIKGGADLNDIGLLEEIENMKIYENTNPNKKNKKENEDKKKSDQFNKSSKITNKSQENERENNDENNNIAVIKKTQQNEEGKVKNCSHHILDHYEALNIEIPSNKDIVRKHYIKKILIEKMNEDNFSFKKAEKNNENDDLFLIDEKYKNKSMLIK